MLSTDYRSFTASDTRRHQGRARGATSALYKTVTGASGSPMLGPCRIESSDNKVLTENQIYDSLLNTKLGAGSGGCS